MNVEISIDLARLLVIHLDLLILEVEGNEMPAKLHRCSLDEMKAMLNEAMLVAQEDEEA